MGQGIHSGEIGMNRPANHSCQPVHHVLNIPGMMCVFGVIDGINRIILNQ
jgi:hypothetical protein|tara:strand:+ start:34 stop:183 length:150 start_codon:yes stop_codon:yes gene_type:complete